MRLPDDLAAGLVFVASGAVLVLEILGVRLLAPYVGLTLETYTTIIGVVLAGIAGGSALGGRAADAMAPEKLLVALLAAGGLLALATVPVVRALGEAGSGGGGGTALLVALVALLPPAAALSAVTPVVVKLQLRELGASGTVVGRLSAWATTGALAGTFGTGFVLVPLLPVTVTVIGVGALLLLTALVAAAYVRELARGAAGGAAVAAVVLAGTALAAGGRCTVESVYYCARVVVDEARADGRSLYLDDLRHAYVALDDPAHLELAYTRWMGDALDAMRRPGEPMSAVFLGGGGFTLPRYLEATRPGSSSRVLEVDREVVDLARSRLGLRTGPRLRVAVGDARVLLRRERDGAADVVVGDAFGGRSIPWHLATEEFARDVRRVLRPGGAYLLNVIDRGGLSLVRAEAATLLEVFANVMMVARDGPAPGNLVLFASDAPLPRFEPRDARLYDRAFVERFARGADALTDDHAPADQLLTP